MKAIVVENAAGPFVLKDLPTPVPGAGEVLVKIHASGVNPLDTKIWAGAAAHARHPLPATLGIDMAGTVEAVGADVETFAVGDDVYGMTGGVGGVQGSLAQYAAVDARLIAHKPASLSMRQAAALPLAVITAWEGMFDRVDVQEGETVLVIGAAGGVGHVALQLAKARGAKTFGVDRAEAADYLRSIGATPIDRKIPVADYVREMTDGSGFDVVYDCVGALDDAFVAVRRFGRVTSSLGWSTHSLAPLSFRAASYSGVFTLLPLLTGEGREAHGHILAEAARLAEAGKLTPRLDDRRFSLDQASDAHALLRDGLSRGKVVVDVSAADPR
ncbi:zinc-dependent alcohol dehydrogenase family protein [Rhizobium sp. P38BS-XIX]|uniref:zinc-dependent alcohol dehydrogenase family protein n=1 Tax=Rhizobium sp. P38BS-XIX TaxID=2726740 RepID=UPI001456608A|nr:zinc-dependent alcohol dehydrogenase family protein [Rhizobium sp. P38BS-XIX]NLR98654.1 zinc-dependent alcohol dehydrogenase family protein [Rhizobium sp. P38BS-XIX]